MRPTIVVVLHSSAAQAQECLSGLAALPAEPDHDVVVVDDAVPGADALMAQIEGDVDLVRHVVPVGLAAAARIGLTRAAGEHVVLLDGAAAPRGDWLAPLVAGLDDPAVAAATSVHEGEASTHPTRARALSARAAELHTAGGIPDVGDADLFGALALNLAAVGQIRPVAASRVTAPAFAPTERDAPAARGYLGADVEVSIVVPTLDATSARVRACIAAIRATVQAPHEIVLVENGAPPQGYTAPVNAGLRAVRGAYAVVMNDDVEVQAGWWQALRAALDDGASVVFPRTLDGFDRGDFAAWCFALSRGALERHAVSPGEFFDPELRVWYQDTDLFHRLLAVGERPRQVPEATVRHTVSTTIGTADPALRAWIERQQTRDLELFMAKHPSVQLRVFNIAA